MTTPGFCQPPIKIDPEDTREPGEFLPDLRAAKHQAQIDDLNLVIQNQAALIAMQQRTIDAMQRQLESRGPPRQSNESEGKFEERPRKRQSPERSNPLVGCENYALFVAAPPNMSRQAVERALESYLPRGARFEEFWMYRKMRQGDPRRTGFALARRSSHVARIMEPRARDALQDDYGIIVNYWMGQTTRRSPLRQALIAAWEGLNR